MAKDLDLCGLGNGLVDLQFAVEEKFLEDVGLRKGEMRLVDSEAQLALMEKLKGRKFNRCSGGSAANTVIAFQAFGGKSAYKTTLGVDEPGKFYADEFKDLGIELFALSLDVAPTGSCVVLITPDSERTMHTSLAATAFFDESNLHERLIERSKWLYLEGYKFSEKSSTEALYKAVDLAKKHDTKISLTFSDLFITETFREHLEYAADNSDLIFCNEAEIKSYTKKDDFDEAVDELASIGANVAATRGSEGSIIVWDGEKIPIPAYKAKPIDSTGAGDMYAGGFLFGIVSTGSPIVAGNLASYSAARIVSQLGARLDDDHKKLRDEILSKIEY